MEREQFKQILPMYVGSECKYSKAICKLIAVHPFNTFNHCIIDVNVKDGKHPDFQTNVNIDEIKLILRPLESMTEEEDTDYYELTETLNVPRLQERFTRNQFLWLIQKGFDIFGLIESGYAIKKED